jgi:hypothetical protein
MRTQLQEKSLALAFRVFRPFLWKYVLHFDTRTSRWVCVSDKGVIRRWVFFDTIFLFCGFLMFPLLIGLTKILNPGLLPSYRLVDAFISILFIMAAGCVVVGELGIFFLRHDGCSAYYNLREEESRTVILSKIKIKLA